jgi:hypothetical protein
MYALAGRVTRRNQWTRFRVQSRCPFQLKSEAAASQAIRRRQRGVAFKVPEQSTIGCSPQGAASPCKPRARAPRPRVWIAVGPLDHGWIPTVVPPPTSPRPHQPARLSGARELSSRQTPWTGALFALQVLDA